MAVAEEGEVKVRRRRRTGAKDDGRSKQTRKRRVRSSLFLSLHRRQAVSISSRRRESYSSKRRKASTKKQMKRANESTKPAFSVSTPSAQGRATPYCC